jgi:diguanylate cyclase (GGDEF)-like protein/PAS domain S-box-containing protein
MPIIPFSPDEAERHALLGSLNLLDTAPEPVFDRVTRLASRLLGVPCAVFSLLDADRQWYKSRIGIDVEETPREHSLCAHAVQQSAPLVVADASLDERFRDNPMVAGPPHARFFASIPIRVASGVAIGALCVVDTAPRTLPDADLEVLVDLAELIAQKIRYRERLSQAQDRLEHSGSRALSSEALFRSVFDLASVGIALVGLDGRWLRANARMCDIVGYSQEQLAGKTFQQLTHPDDLPSDLALLARLERDDVTQYQLDKRYLRADGSHVWVNLNVNTKRGAGGEAEYYVIVVKDITAQKAAQDALRQLHADLEARVQARTAELREANLQLREALARQAQAEEALRERETELSSVIEHANDAYIALDETDLVTTWNRQAEETFGWSRQEALGKPLVELIIPQEVASAYREDMEIFRATGSSSMLNQRLELPARRKDGSGLVVEVRTRPLLVNGRRILSTFVHDISERKRLEAQREYESRHDALTGLLNRRAMADMLPLAQARARRNRQALALLFIDLDGFKAVNDTWGHDAGDLLLRTVAHRIAATLRQSDTAFRLAGDEFTVILEALGQGCDAAAVAAKLVEAIALPLALPSGVAQVGASIGIGLFQPDSAASPETLVKEADGWMYRAKQAGRGQVLPHSQSGPGNAAAA